MTRATITHVLRAPIVGGSELETLAIVSQLSDFEHRVVFPARYRDWQPSIQKRFPVAVEPVPDLQACLDRLRQGVVHIQFPFLQVDAPVGHDSVLELQRLPTQPTVFTVHAAVNVPIVPHVHYVFHTQDLAARFAERIPASRRSICPSLVAPPAAVRWSRRCGSAPRILWVSRNEDAKFHPDVGAIVAQVLTQHPGVQFRFVGRCEHVRLPDDPRVDVISCPVPDLAAEWTQADVFWYFPHPLLEETWCRTVTEAMAHGLPCVVAAHGAMAQQVGDGAHGLVVAEPSACVLALLQLVEMDSAARRRVAAANHARAMEFAQTAVAHWQALYERLSGPSRMP